MNSLKKHAKSSLNLYGRVLNKIIIVNSFTSLFILSRILYFYLTTLTLAFIGSVEPPGLQKTALLTL